MRHPHYPAPAPPPPQVFLLLACFVAVPWMLLPKPLILKKRHEARLAQVDAAGCHVVWCCMARLAQVDV